MGVVMEQAVTGKWLKVCRVEDIPQLGARVVKRLAGGAHDCDIAVFRNAEDEIFALADKCPHKGGPLSQGIVFGRKVACPLHNWNIQLEDGEAAAPDAGCAKKYAVKVENGDIFLQL